jgi:signal transduction histidine kinase
MAEGSPDYVRVTRTAAWMWLAYLVGLAAIDMLIYASGPKLPILWYHLLNGLPAAIFLALAYSPWMKQASRAITALMLLLISAAPILLSQVLGLRLPQAPLSNVEGMFLRQLPVLLIALVLVAWHYSLAVMLLYTVGVNVLELALVLALGRPDDPRLISFYFIVLIRTVCFVVVGIFVNRLITLLRGQHESLQSANHQLRRYAGTLESLTVSRERNRMSRELHDTVVHTLSGLAVQLEAIKAYWGVEPETARNRLDQALDTTRAGLQETRRAIRALRASPLDDLGLVLSLRRLAETAAERAGLRLSLALPDPPVVLSSAAEQCLYRVTQEAVENVVHHASASSLAVQLKVTEAETVLVVEDDGVGFDPGARPPSGHFGLAGMRERAELAGGALLVSSQPGKGTSLRLVIRVSEP